MTSLSFQRTADGASLVARTLALAVVAVSVLVPASSALAQSIAR
jgi:hypothetical protein